MKHVPNRVHSNKTVKFFSREQLYLSPTPNQYGADILPHPILYDCTDQNNPSHAPDDSCICMVTVKSQSFLLLQFVTIHPLLVLLLEVQDESRWNWNKFKCFSQKHL